MSYEDQLKSPQWYYVRDRVLERDHWRCKQCRSDRNLQVHHKYYIQGKKAWEYNDEALVTLCDRCHERAHGKGEAIDDLDIALQRLVTVAAGVRTWCENANPKEDTTNGEAIH